VSARHRLLPGRKNDRRETGGEKFKIMNTEALMEPQAHGLSDQIIKVIPNNAAQYAAPTCCVPPLPKGPHLIWLGKAV
jgi:hypothetical protein